MGTLRQRTRKNMGTVVSVSPVGDQLVRVVFTARDEIAAWRPGQVLGVMVDPDGASMKVRWRHYTVRSYEPGSGQFELLMTLHDAGGPGTRWVTRAQPGDSFIFLGPVGGLSLIDDASDYLLVGDRTALASFGGIIDGLPDAARIRVVIATPEPNQALLVTRRGTAVEWLQAETAEEIRAQLQAALPDDFPATGQAYVLGELHMMRAVRDALTEAGLPRKRVAKLAHWTPNKVGM